MRGQVLGHLVEDDHGAVIGRHVAVHSSPRRRGSLRRRETLGKQLGKALRANGLALAAVGADDEHKALLGVHFEALKVHFVHQEAVATRDQRVLGKNDAKPFLKLMPDLAVGSCDLLSRAVGRKGHACNTPVLIYEALQL